MRLVSSDIPEEDSNQKSEEEEDKNRKEPSEINLLYDARTHNKKYSGLFQSLGLAGANWFYYYWRGRWQVNWMLIFNQQMFQRQIDDSQIKAINCFFYLKYPIEKVLFSLKMKLEQVRKYVKKFKKCLKQNEQSKLEIFWGRYTSLILFMKIFIREIIAYQTKQPETLQSIRIKQ